MKERETKGDREGEGRERVEKGIEGSRKGWRRGRGGRNGETKALEEEEEGEGGERGRRILE